MSTIRLSFIGLAARVFVLALTFIASILVARGIGPAGMGEYFVVITTAALLATFCDLGLSSSAVLFSGERRRRLVSIGGTLLIVAVTVPTLVAVALHAAYDSPAIWGHSRMSAIAAIVIAPMTLYNNYWTFLLVGRKQITVSNAYQCATYIAFTAVLGVLAAFREMTVDRVLIAHIVVFGMQTVAQAVWVFGWRHRENDFESIKPAALLREMIRFGLPAYPSTVATVVTLRISVPMVMAYHGSLASGVFSVAFQLSDKLQLIARSIQDAIYDNVIALRGSEAVRALNRYLRSAALLFAAISVIGVIAAPLAVRIFYGKAFAGSIVPLQLLIVGSAVFGMATLLSTYFIGQIKRPVILSWIASASAVIAVVANRILVPLLAADGAALAMLLTQSVVLLACLVVYRRFSGSDLRSVLVLSGSDARDLRNRAQAWLASIRPTTMS